PGISPANACFFVLHAFALNIPYVLILREWQTYSIAPPALNTSR
ncbi:11210_t:CDS:1, partial [Ambispora gerdemannii]